MAHRPSRWTRRCIAARAACALAVLGLMLPGSPAAAGVYTNSTLNGAFAAHDFFALLDGSGATANGVRRFENGQQVSFVTTASQTPLNYAVLPEGSFRIFKTGSGAFDSGQTGSIGLQGGFAAYQRQAAANGDPQIPAGYAALRLSLARPSGMRNADFDGEYAYAALLYTPSEQWRNLTGVVLADGTGHYTLTRSDASGSAPYSIDAEGQVLLGSVPRGAASIDASGDILLQTVDVLPGRDPLFPSGANGLAFYLRRMDAATSADFRGTYRVHRLTVRPGGNNRIDVGSITAGGAGVYFGTLNGAAYDGRIALGADGQFSIAGDATRTGVLGMDGDLALVWPPAGLVSGSSGSASLELWVRTAGGGPIPGDSDGDSLSDAEETAAGTSPGNPDSDGDGLLDNADPAPNQAGNVITATLAPASITLPEENLTPPTVTLTLDSHDFPYFDWSLSSSTAWARVAPASGSGDATVQVTLDTRNFTVAGSPYTADLRVTAPAMRALQPIRLTVNVVRNLEVASLSPDSLSFTGVEGGLAPASQPVSLSTGGTQITQWTAQTDALWLKSTPTSGTGPATLNISVDPAGLVESATPYTGTLKIITNRPDTPAAQLSVSFRVLPRRDFGVGFGVGAGDEIQANPAVDCSPETGRYAITWSERGTIYGAAIDDLGGPRFPRTALSIPAVGLAQDPNVAVDRARNIAWFVWQQQFGEDLNTGLQARTLNLSTNVVGNAFGIASAGGAMTQPRMVYDAANDALLIAYVLRGDALAEVRLLRYNLATRSPEGESTVATTLSEAIDPALAVDAVNGTVLVAWREQRATEDESYSRVYTRLFRSVDGAALSAAQPVRLSARFQRTPALHILPETNTYSASWVETTTPAGVIGSMMSVQIDARTGAANATPTEISTTVAPTGIAGRYATSRFQSVLVWSDHAMGDQGTYARTTPGAFQLGPAAHLPYLGAPQYTPAIAYHPLRNEFLVVWQDLGVLPAQIYATRLDGGSADNDGDGLPNVWELQYGLNPFVAEGDDGADGDPDGDGATNLDELAMGTDPTNPDSDGDSLLDAQEDANRNGVLDPGETSPNATDTDGDGADDAAEWFLGSNGNDAASRPATGLFRVAYGNWALGQPGTLTLWLYASKPETLTLHLNPGDAVVWQPPAGWTVPAPAPLTLTAGTHAVPLTITPGLGLTPSQWVASFAFSLSAPGVSPAPLTARLVVDPRTTTLPEDAETTPAALAARFAPVLRAHHDEFYPPIPVETTLAAASLLPQGSAALLRPPATLELFQIPQAEALLDLPGTDVAALHDAFAGLPPAPATIYYTFAALGGLSEESIPPEGAAYALQYYVHFFADEWGRGRTGGHRHEGDWEMAQVMLNAAFEPLALTATRRWANAQAGQAVDGSAQVAWDSVEQSEDGHPILYLGQGSHTPFFHPGATRVGMGLDTHDGLGRWYLPEGAATPDYPDTAPLALVPLGRLGEAENPAWLRYAGRWGQRNFPATPVDAVPGLHDGPVGPLFMGDAPDATSSTGVVQFWNDPYAWQVRAPQDPPVAMSRVTGVLPEAFAGTTVVLLDARGRRFVTTLAEGEAAFALDVPVQHYSLAVVDTGALGVETFRAAALFPTGTGERNLFPTLPDTTPLGSFLYTSGYLLGDGSYPVADSDGDGIPDKTDPDQDNDGVPNGSDPDALGDGWDDRYQVQDPDGNGIPRYYDADAPPAEPGAPADFDDDGFVDAIDLDWDNDGYPNDVETAAGTNPRNFYDRPGQRAGDLDGNGELNSVDLQRLVNIALRRDPFNLLGDLDGDGQVTAVDVQLLLDRVLKR